MYIKLFQVLSYKNASFRNLESLQRIENRGPIPEDYFLAWEGDVKADNPEDIFFIFNHMHPQDYKGRSMSVSDVVQIGEYFPSFYFCDSIGFSKLEDFDGSIPGTKLDALRRHFGTFQLNDREFVIVSEPHNKELAMFRWPTYQAMAVCTDPTDLANKQAEKAGSIVKDGYVLKPNEDFYSCYAVEWSILPEFVYKDEFDVYHIDTAKAEAGNLPLFHRELPQQVAWLHRYYCVAQDRPV